jgi:dienelactone hydrolase
LKTIETKKLTFYYKEPENQAIKHTVFFFSLSAEDSLTLAPFCRPVDTLIENGVRVVSVTLPGHENNARPYGIQEIWLKEKETLKTFLKDLKEGIVELTKHFPPPYGAMGISRGAFIALLMATQLKEITAITCFAPLLYLKGEKDLSVLKKIPELTSKKIHFFVGDTDTLIGTKNVIKLHHDLQEISQDKEAFEIKISPAIGRYGHGTSDDIFKEGALWLAKSL